MKKVICKKEYDTQLAEVVKKFTFGSFGDEDGYEETLYVTADGNYFEYVNGGAKSKHPQENITRVAKTAVDKWLESHK